MGEALKAIYETYEARIPGSLRKHTVHRLRWGSGKEENGIEEVQQTPGTERAIRKALAKYFRGWRKARGI